MAVAVRIDAEIEIRIEEVNIESYTLIHDRHPTHTGTVAAFLRRVVTEEEV